jgi:VIT1/CCC1 family predicted Fe2+/Mn2+ transporter
MQESERSPRPGRHHETHFTNRIGLLRAAVLGANDGIVSIASLIVGVAAADTSPGAVFVAGVAGTVAGAMSMAAGEYVSVSSQADSRRADLDRERHELRTDPAHEHRELAGIYVQRGLNAELARQVATQLMVHDALGAHARDELGLTETSRPRPVRAASISAISFLAGSAIPLAAILGSPGPMLIPAVSGSALVCLAGTGALAAWAGGAKLWAGAARVTVWGAAAMVATAIIGLAVGAAV